MDTWQSGLLSNIKEVMAALSTYMMCFVVLQLTIIEYSDTCTVTGKALVFLRACVCMGVSVIATVSFAVWLFDSPSYHAVSCCIFFSIVLCICKAASHVISFIFISS